MDDSTFPLHKAQTAPMLLQQHAVLSVTGGKDFGKLSTSSKQLPTTQTIPLQNICPATHEDNLESNVASLPPAHEAPAMKIAERPELKRHARRWFLALSLALALAAGAGAGAMVGVMTHRADLGIATTIGVGTFVACIEALVLSVLR